MSNRLYQTVLHQMKDVIGRTIGIIDENGIITYANSGAISKAKLAYEIEKALGN